jgi:hypothetical protein
MRAAKCRAQQEISFRLAPLSLECLVRLVGPWEGLESDGGIYGPFREPVPNQTRAASPSKIEQRLGLYLSG